MFHPSRRFLDHIQFVAPEFNSCMHIFHKLKGYFSQIMSVFLL